MKEPHQTFEREMLTEWAETALRHMAKHNPDSYVYQQIAYVHGYCIALVNVNRAESAFAGRLRGALHDIWSKLD